MSTPAKAWGNAIAIPVCGDDYEIVSEKDDGLKT
jgi:hypothetical protein